MPAANKAKFAEATPSQDNRTVSDPKFPADLSSSTSNSTPEQTPSGIAAAAREYPRLSLLLSCLAFLVSIIAWAWPFFGWPTPGQTEVRTSTARQYFQALHSATAAPDGTESSSVGMALAHSSPGSPAEQYALVLQVSWSANPSAPQDSDNMKFDYQPGLVRGCPDLNKEAGCIKYENLRFDEDNRLKDFTTGGIPISQATFAAAEEARSSGSLSTRFLGGIQNVSGKYFGFTLEVRNNGKAPISIERNATYLDVDSKRHEVSIVGHTQLEVAQPTLLYVLAPARHGGWVGFDTVSGTEEPIRHWVKVP